MGENNGKLENGVVLIKISQNEIMIKDNATGIPCDILFQSLMVPSVSDPFSLSRLLSKLFLRK